MSRKIVALAIVMIFISAPTYAQDFYVGAKAGWMAALETRLSFAVVSGWAGGFAGQFIAAGLFAMADYTILASTEPHLFHRLLQRFAMDIHRRTAAVAHALPGRLWRIYGPEYASPPYLHPRLFQEYVVNYDKPMVKAIHASHGYARIHSHGRLRLILAAIAATGCAGLDPIEPPPQGDMCLAEVRELVGEQMVLFGNLEASDLENLPAADFREKVRTALAEGVGGRGFVLMPSACPYGRVLTRQALRNYEVMVEEVERMLG